MNRVVIESPFAGDVVKNLDYLRECMIDSLRRGEAPFASHAIYPQVLDDAVLADRRLGIDAGFAWGNVADAIAFYVDLGMSPGMHAAMDRWVARGAVIETRTIGR